MHTSWLTTEGTLTTTSKNIICRTLSGFSFRFNFSLLIICVELNLEQTSIMLQWAGWQSPSTISPQPYRARDFFLVPYGRKIRLIFSLPWACFGCLTAMQQTGQKQRPKDNKQSKVKGKTRDAHDQVAYLSAYSSSVNGWKSGTHGSHFTTRLARHRCAKSPSCGKVRAKTRVYTHQPRGRRTLKRRPRPRQLLPTNTTARSNNTVTSTPALQRLAGGESGVVV